MTLSLILGLLVFGIVLVLVEIFITPGIVVGIIGGVMISLGVYFSYRDFGDAYGLTSVIFTVLILTFSIFFAFRNGAWNRFATQRVIDGKANNIHLLKVDIGDIGTTLSALRPAGTALLNGQKMEVHTEGGFLLANVPIEVVKRVQNKVFVKQINA
jgi:membrane-bound ClpP family serine protease